MESGMKTLAKLFFPTVVVLLGLAALLQALEPAIAAVALYVAAFLGVRTGKLPIVKWKRPGSANGRNWPGTYVEVDPNHSHKRSVLAQEMYESGYKLNPINLVRTRISRSDQRKMELMGHEVEVQAAVAFYGVNEADHRLNEARAMYAGYEGLFKDMPSDEIVGEMEQRAGKARKWVEDHLDGIKTR
jgi:hypothetical protein